MALVRKGVRHHKAFNASTHGGWSSALVHAQRWRDEIVRTHPPELRRERAMRLRANSPGPIPGVTPEFHHSGVIKLWRAKTSLGPAKVLQRAFSVARWGAAAQEMAVAERMRQLQQMTGASRVHQAEDELRERPPDLLPAPPPRRPVSAPLRRTNNSGVSGVVRRAGRGGRGGYWTAQSAAGGHWVSRSFSIDRYGDAVARQLAVEERLRQLSTPQERDPA